jgi:hypothetical protein
MRILPENEKVLIVDTGAYAGNFEREMVAFITGQIGECSVGTEAAVIAGKELPADVLLWFEQNVIQTSDDHGCYRPASISKTPNSDDYNSVEFVVEEWPPSHMLYLIHDRAKDFCKRFNRERGTLSRIKCLPVEDQDIPFIALRKVERTVSEVTVMVLE